MLPWRGEEGGARDVRLELGGSGCLACARRKLQLRAQIHLRLLLYTPTCHGYSRRHRLGRSDSWHRLATVVASLVSTACFVCDISVPS